MNWFKNLRLSGKLLASFTVVLVITSALGILSIVRLGDLAAQTTELAEVNMPSLDLLGSDQHARPRISGSRRSATSWRTRRTSSRRSPSNIDERVNRAQRAASSSTRS